MGNTGHETLHSLYAHKVPSPRTPLRIGKLVFGVKGLWI